METMQQPKIAGYRQLSESEAELINEGKALAAAVGEWIAKLRAHPATHDQPCMTTAPCVFDPLGQHEKPTIDQRWVSVGATQLQQGFMAVTRGIAQPESF